MTKYFEVTGKTKQAIDATKQKMEDGRTAMRAFAKKHGAEGIAVREGFHAEFVLVFKKKTPDAAEWKSVKSSGRTPVPQQYEPRLKSQAGKLAAKEMWEICKNLPTAADIGKLLGMNCLSNELNFRAPGWCARGNRLMVEVYDDYKVPKKIAADMKRVSDVDFEKFEKTK